MSDPDAAPGTMGTDEGDEAEAEEKPPLWPWVRTVLEGLPGPGCLLTLAVLAAVAITVPAVGPRHPA